MCVRHKKLMTIVQRIESNINNIHTFLDKRKEAYLLGSLTPEDTQCLKTWNLQLEIHPFSQMVRLENRHAVKTAANSFKISKHVLHTWGTSTETHSMFEISVFEQKLHLRNSKSRTIIHSCFLLAVLLRTCEEMSLHIALIYTLISLTCKLTGNSVRSLPLWKMMS